MIRVALLDDHPIVHTALEGLSFMSGGRVGTVLHGTTSGVFMAAIDGVAVDVAIVDLLLGDRLDGPGVVAELALRKIPSLLYTAESRPVPVRRAMAAGARGLVLKSDPVDELVAAVEAVAAGGEVVGSEVAHALIEDPTLVPHLSPREVQVLQLLHAGVPRKAVGRMLEPPASDASVATYLRRALAKYRQLRPVPGVAEMLRQAYGDGWFTD